MKWRTSSTKSVTPQKRAPSGNVTRSSSLSSTCSLRLPTSAFGREYQPANRAEDIVFDIGQACRDDFGEVVMLTSHGLGSGGMKLLRGMFERAITAAYLIKNPEKG
jgi:hypothetical protein